MPNRPLQYKQDGIEIYASRKPDIDFILQMLKDEGITKRPVRVDWAFPGDDDYVSEEDKNAKSYQPLPEKDTQQKDTSSILEAATDQ